MTSDTRRGRTRWPALVLLAGLAAGCGESGEKKADAPPTQSTPQPQPKSQKPPPPGVVKME